MGGTYQRSEKAGFGQGTLIWYPVKTGEMRRGNGRNLGYGSDYLKCCQTLRVQTLNACWTPGECSNE